PVYTICVASPITMASAGRAGRRIFQTRAWRLSRLVIFAALCARISRTRLSPCERCAAGLQLASADARASMAARASAWIGTAAEYSDVGQWLARADGAAPDEDQRALGPREAIRGLIDRGRIGHRQGRCAPRLPLRLDGRREDVPRQRQVYRARPAAAKHSIGTRNQFRQLVRISDHGAERGEPGRDRRL